MSDPEIIPEDEARLLGITLEAYLQVFLVIKGTAYSGFHLSKILLSDIYRTFIGHFTGHFRKMISSRRIY